MTYLSMEVSVNRVPIKLSENQRSEIASMTDAMYSLEEGMGHTPLFNDAGDNVARSMLSLLAALREEFSIAPVNKNAFPDA